MADSHSIGNPAHTGGKYRRRMTISFALIACFFVLELTVAVVSGSLSLLSDAGHMAADVVAMGAALTATRMATRPDKTGQRTFGSYRAEVFASGLAVILMLGVSIYVIIEAISRAHAHPQVQTMPMFVVGILGLCVNLVTMMLLSQGASESINIKGAYLEVVADAAGSVGVIAAAALMAWTDMPIWDTVFAIAIGVFVSVRAVWLGREVVAVLGQHVPGGLVVDDVASDLSNIAGVQDVHDLHAWVLTSGMNVASAHLVVDEASKIDTVLALAHEILRTKYGVEHATLQVEHRPSAQCHDINW